MIDEAPKCSNLPQRTFRIHIGHREKNIYSRKTIYAEILEEIGEILSDGVP